MASASFAHLTTRLTVVVIAAGLVACGGGAQSPTAPTPTPTSTPSQSPTPSPAPSIPAVVAASITSPAGTTERTSTGVTYHINFALRETSGRAGATVTSIVVRFYLNGASDGQATITNLAQTALVANGSIDYRLNVSDNTGNVDNGFSVAVNYTEDNGRASAIEMASNSAIIAPPAVNPAPPAGSAFDGTYDFTFSSPEPGGVVLSHTTARYFRVVNGRISTTDGLLSGTVDTFGKVLGATSVCPFAGKDPATWIGDLNAGVGPTGKFGKGTYSCVGSPTYSWSVNNGR